MACFQRHFPSTGVLSAVQSPLGTVVVLGVELTTDGKFVKGKLLPTRQEGEGRAQAR